MSFGDRLIEERKRLGLTQAEFSKKIGISRNSQVNYEAGKREPGVGYLDAIGKLGVDVSYVTTGIQLAVDSLEHRVLSKMLDEIGTALGLNNELWDCYNNLLGQEIGLLPEVFVPGFESAYIGTQNDRLEEVINGSILNKIKHGTLNEKLLVGILKGIDTATSTKRIVLTPEKRAAATVLLYRTFIQAGKINQSAINEAIKLAS